MYWVTKAGDSYLRPHSTHSTHLDEGKPLSKIDATPTSREKTEADTEWQDTVQTGGVVNTEYIILSPTLCILLHLCMKY